MLGWVKFLLTLKKLLSVVREFFIYMKAKRDGRQEQADKQAELDDKAVKRADIVRAEYDRGGLRDVAKKHHVDE